MRAPTRRTQQFFHVNRPAACCSAVSQYTALGASLSTHLSVARVTRDALRTGGMKMKVSATATAKLT